MSWTAALLAGQSNTGRRIFIEPERVEVTEYVRATYYGDATEIRGKLRILVKYEKFRGNYVLTYRTARGEAIEWHAKRLSSMS